MLPQSGEPFTLPLPEEKNVPKPASESDVKGGKRKGKKSQGAEDAGHSPT